jgi:AcrR family transcriptional regulator
MTEGRRGRPRDQALHDVILQTTRALLVDRGYAEVSMDRVASSAGVGKQTLYRRWASKAPLVAEAVMDAARLAGSAEVPDTDDVAADLHSWLNRNATFVSNPQNAGLVRALAAAAADDPHEGDLIYRQLTGPQHDALMQRLRKGIDSGQVRADADLGAVADAIIGAALYRMLARTPEAGPGPHGDGLVEVLMLGVRPRQ